MPILALLSLLAAFPPLAIDMYLPSIPILQCLWGVPYSVVSHSLILFLATFSIFLLIHGPLSDRFGRRPVLMGGILLFILGSGGCATANSVTTFLWARAIQGAGAAAASSLSLALTKDLFKGHNRQKILGYVGVIMTFCPMIAPSLGVVVLNCLSWRWIFLFQILVALVSFYGVYRLKEPLVEFTKGGAISVAKRYITVFKNVRFTVLATAFALVVLPHFGFIGGAADIYINGFGMSEQVFGVYFAINALGFMVGSFVCTLLCNTLNPLSILYSSLLTIMGSGLLMHILGGTAPWTMALPMICISFSVGFSRPVANSMILDQVDKDVGAASGIMTFEMFFVAAIAVEIISLEWSNKPLVLGSLALAGAFFPLAVLLAVRRKVRQVPKRNSGASS
ncbi:MFS transporter [Oleidesulfovibrio sp.]|uniref:MFS transporter n=1 Tax=Oleidesulfovibrio sp. TaxID=2909707 RepID=UPI003A86A2DA